MELELLECLNRIVADRYRAVLMRTFPVLDTGPKGGPSMKAGELRGLGSLADDDRRYLGPDDQQRLVPRHAGDPQQAVVVGEGVADMGLSHQTEGLADRHRLRPFPARQGAHQLRHDPGRAKGVPGPHMPLHGRAREARAPLATHRFGLRPRLARRPCWHLGFRPAIGPVGRAAFEAADVVPPVVRSALMRLGFSGFRILPSSAPKNRRSD